MNNDNDKGICLFAYNNEKIDYCKIATICGMLAKTNLNLPVALVSDEGSISWLQETVDKKYIERAFDYFIVENVVHESNKRIHHDSPWFEFVAEFKNSNKHDIYNLSPFKKTLLIDSDYFILSNNLEQIFDTDFNLAMFEQAKTVRNDYPGIREIWLSDNGIKMWWSTVIYFTKNPLTKMFFELWNHVKDNYDYYQFLYKFPKGLYRTDFAVSIATHILNGRVTGDIVNNLPQNFMYFSKQEDDIFNVSNQSISFLANDVKENWKDIPVNWHNQDVHIMNKQAILRHYNNFLEFYD